MYFVYVLLSDKTKRFYVGFSTNPNQRLKTHNSGGNKSTKLGKPWQLLYLEGYRNKADALGREKFLKGTSGKVYIKKQLKNTLSNVLE